MNHPAWTIGHLVYSCQQIGGEIGLEPWLGNDWKLQFGTGSTPIADPTAYPDKPTLLLALDEGQRRLSDKLTSTKEGDRAQPLPDVRYRSQFPTLGHAVLDILTAHTAMHVGQITVWRRAMGLAAVQENLPSDRAQCSQAAGRPI